MLGIGTRFIAASGFLTLAIWLCSPANAQVTQEPLGGQPAPGSLRSMADFDYQIKYQRAFEAVLWSLPSVGIQHGRVQTFALGMTDNDIIAMSGPATPKFETITPNSSTNYIVAYTDLKQDPVVLEIPAAGPDGSLYGQVVDAWQFTIPMSGRLALTAARAASCCSPARISRARCRRATFMCHRPTTGSCLRSARCEVQARRKRMPTPTRND
jgi:hypothetical protein